MANSVASGTSLYVGFLIACLSVHLRQQGPCTHDNREPQCCIQVAGDFPGTGWKANPRKPSRQEQCVEGQQRWSKATAEWQKRGVVMGSLSGCPSSNPRADPSPQPPSWSTKHTMKKLFDATVQEKFKELVKKSLKNWGNNYVAE